MRLFILFLSLVFSVQLSAQESKYALVFDISAARAENLLVSGEKSLDFLINKTPIDSIKVGQDLSHLAVGHYLVVSNAGEKLHWRLLSHNKHQLYIQSDNKRLNVALVDEYGMAVEEAQMRIEKRAMHWDEKTQTYGRARAKNGLLVTYLPTDTLFYQLTEVYTKPIVWRRLAYFKSSKVGRIVSAPMRWVTSPYRYFKRGFKYKNWRVYNWPFRRLITRTFSKKNKKIKGYIASNQPVYRIGDTLKLAAYITDKKGRAVKDPLALSIRQGRKVYLQKMLEAQEKGQYTLDWVLADSLKLDAQYHVKIQANKKRKLSSLSYNFKIEDYELKEYNYAIDNQNASFKSYETVELKLRAEDINKLAVPATTIKGYILRNNFAKLYTDSVSVPDTLWQFTEQMGNRTQLSVFPPDSIWPLAQTRAKLHVRFQGPSGEGRSMQTSLTVDRAPWEPVLELRADSLYAFIANEKDLDTQSTPTLVASLADGHKRQQKLAPQQSIALHAAAVKYEWEVADKKAVLDMNKERDKLSFNYTWHADSLSLHWNNPRKLMVYWRLKGATTIQEGYSQDSIIHIELKKSVNAKKLWLKYDYMWAGKAMNQYATLEAYKNELKVDLEVPDEIYPGQTQDIAVTIKDSKGRAVPNAVVSTAAYNAQFRQGTAYTAPNISYKKRRTPFVRQQYKINKAKTSKSLNLTMDWYEKLALQDQLYYRIRFPEDAGLLEYRAVKSQDSLAQKRAQIAPYVVKNGQLQPVYMVYIDNQLVYYYKAWQDTPYSLVSTPGYHDITLRTQDAEIHLSRVELKAGQILDFSIDLDRYGTSQRRLVPQPDYLTANERLLLNKKVFYSHPFNKFNKVGGTFLYATPDCIFKKTYANRRVAEAWGIFSSRDSLHWIGQDSIQFLFEPGFSYVVDKNRDRLYQHKPFSGSTKYKLPEKLNALPVGQEAIFLADLPEPKIQKTFKFKEYLNLDENAVIQLFTSPSVISKSDAILVFEQDSLLYLYPPHKRFFHLKEGQYTFAYLLKDSILLKQKLYAKKHHLTAYKVKRSNMYIDSLSTDEQFFLEQHRVFISIENTHVNQPIQFKNNPYKGIGRMVRGYVREAESKEAVLFGSVVCGDYPKIGTETNLDGYFELWMPWEATSIEFSYLGFRTKRIEFEEIDLLDGLLEVTLDEEAVVLDAIMIIEYKQPLTERDITSLPTRNIHAIAATTAGISSSDAVSIRGSRDAATNYYTDGQRVTDSTDGDGKTSLLLQNLNLPADSIRDSFRDYAYWQPLLLTNKAGQVRFPVTFPDDITNWRHYSIVMKKQGVGLSQAFTSAYLPLQAQLYTPRFLLEGDQSSLKGVLTNRTGEELAVHTFLRQADGSPIKEEEISLGMSKQQSFDLAPVSSGTDSLTYAYGLKWNNYQDGEVRDIPVYPVGRRQTVGAYKVLRKDSTYQIDADPAHGMLSIRVGGNGLPQMIKELQWLRDYPYGCNEQTASRLMALLSLKSIQQPADTFDVQLEQDIVKMIHRLDKNRYENGTWGWWKTSSNYSVWISLHVLRALRKAERLGYSIPDVLTAERLLIAELPNMAKSQRLDALKYFAEQKQQLDYATYLAPYDTMSRNFDDELAYRRIQQLSGLPYQLDSLEKYTRKTLTGAQYWGSSSWYYYSPYRRNVRQTLLAYELYRTAGNTEVLGGIQQYFMEDDPFHPEGVAKDHWALNTYEAASITENLLPDLLGEGRQLDTLRLVLDVPNSSSRELRNLPHEERIMPSTTQPVTLDKQGDGPAFLSYSQTYWEPDPMATSNGFSIKSSLWAKGKEVKKLKVGEPAVLKVEVSPEQDAEYVLVEIPIPAGCSYGDKRFRENYYETHREYKRDRVAIFLEKLPKGTYTFTVNLEPRFQGTYTINPAAVEMMYVPVFNGSTVVKGVVVEE